MSVKPARARRQKRQAPALRARERSSSSLTSIAIDAIDRCPLAVVIARGRTSDPPCGLG